MVKLTSTEKVGFMELILGLLKREREGLQKGGLDMEFLVATLEKHLATVLEANADQEELKGKSVASTKTANTAQRNGYVFASGALDMAIAAVGKDSDLAENFRRVRSRVRRPDNGEPSEASDPPTSET